MVKAGVAAEGAFGKVDEVGAVFFGLRHEAQDARGVSPDGGTYGKLAGRDTEGFGCHAPDYIYFR